jgi:hypothetical protein
MRDLQRNIQLGLDHPGFDQPVKCPAKRVVIRHFFQPNVDTPLRRILKQGDEAAITLLLMFPQHQAGKELRISKIFAAEFRPPLQTGLGQRMSSRKYLPWRFTRLHPASSTDVLDIAPPNMRLTFRGLRQSTFIRVYLRFI